MCLSNVNATIRCFKDLKTENGVKSYVDKLYDLHLETNATGKFIGGFYIIIQMNLFKSSVETRQNINVLNQHGVLNCKIRLTRLADLEAGEVPVSLDINEFDIDLTDVTENDNYLNIDKALKCDRLYLPRNQEKGSYIFELLLKRNTSHYNDEEWALQSICELDIYD